MWCVCSHTLIGLVTARVSYSWMSDRAKSISFPYTWLCSVSAEMTNRTRHWERQQTATRNVPAIRPKNVVVNGQLACTQRDKLWIRRPSTEVRCLWRK